MRRQPVYAVTSPANYDPEMPELREIRAFVAAAEQLNFSRAARSLGVSQQALSDRIRRLEDDLGLALFDRDTRHVELTPAGQLLLEHGRAVERAVAALQEAATRFGRGQTGVVRLGYPRSAVFDTAPRIVANMRDTYPDLDVVSVELPTPILPTAVRDGRLDAALVRWSDDLDGLFYEDVRRQRLGVVLRAHDPLSSRDEVPLHELRDRVLLLHDRSASPARHDAIVEACRAAGFTPRLARRRLEFDPTFSDVAEGLGVIIAAASVQATLPGILRWRPLVGTDLEEAIRIVWSPARAHDARDRLVAIARRTALEHAWLA
jgi:DNA-binding transcriptional LysR family regulator